VRASKKVDQIWLQEAAYVHSVRITHPVISYDCAKVVACRVWGIGKGEGVCDLEDGVDRKDFR